MIARIRIRRVVVSNRRRVPVELGGDGGRLPGSTLPGAERRVGPEQAVGNACLELLDARDVDGAADEVVYRAPLERREEFGPLAFEHAWDGRVIWTIVVVVIRVVPEVVHARARLVRRRAEERHDHCKALALIEGRTAQEPLSSTQRLGELPSAPSVPACREVGLGERPCGEMPPRTVIARTRAWSS